MNENYVNVEEKCFAYEESVVRNEVPHTHTDIWLYSSGRRICAKRKRNIIFDILIFFGGDG